MSTTRAHFEALEWKKDLLYLLSIPKPIIRVGKGNHNRKRQATGPRYAGDFLCYWTVVELGMPMVDLARKFDLTPAAVSCPVQRGEKMVKEKDYQLETGDI